MRAAEARSTFPGRFGPFLLVIGALAFSVMLGAMTVLAGSSTAIVLGAGVAAIFVLGGLIAFTLDLPVIVALRFAFIGSFFIKTDLSLLKIDEIEDPSGLNLSLTLALAAVLFLYDQFADERPQQILPGYAWLLLGGLFLSAVGSVLLSGSEMLGWFSVFSFAGSVFIAYAAAAHFCRRDRLTDLIAAVALGLLLTGAAAASQYFIEFPVSWPALGTGTEEEMLGTQTQLLARVPAFMRTPTEMAWVVAALVPLTLSPLFCRVRGLSTWQRWLFIASSIAGTIAVILSLARGSWIALAVAVPLAGLVGWFCLTNSERFSSILSAMAVIVVATMVLAPFAPRIYDRLTGDDQGSADIRSPLMENAVNLIAANPIAGVGMNGYRSNMTKYDDTGIFVSQVFPNPVHNAFAHITGEIGIPGGILFCLLVIVAIFECVRSLSSPDRIVAAIAVGLGVGLIAFVISAMKEPGSLGSVRPPIRTFFLMFGVAMALARIRRISVTGTI